MERKEIQEFYHQNGSRLYKKGRTLTEYRARNLYRKLEGRVPLAEKENVRRALLTNGPYQNNALREILLAEYTCLEETCDEIVQVPLFIEACRYYNLVIDELKKEDSSFRPYIHLGEIRNKELEPFVEDLLTTRLRDDKYSFEERRKVLQESSLLALAPFYVSPNTSVEVRYDNEFATYFMVASPKVKEKTDCELLWIDTEKNVINGKNGLSFLMEVEGYTIDQAMDVMINLNSLNIPLRKGVDKVPRDIPYYPFPKEESYPPFTLLKRVPSTNR